MFTFTEATKEKAKARIALVGPSGAGKTYTALKLAAGFGGPIAVIDSERGSASKYSGKAEGFPSFMTLRPERFDVRKFGDMMKAAADVCGTGTLIIDSLTAWWSGPGGMMELVDSIAAQSSSKNSFQAWGKVRPFEKAMFDAILNFPGHVIVTMRVKTEYVIEENARGKKEPRKVGLAPEQRQGVEYEFDIVGDMTPDNELVVSKSRCRAVRERGRFPHPGGELSKLILDWLNDGVEPIERAPAPPESGEELAPQTPRSGRDMTPELRASDLLARLNKCSSKGELLEMWNEINSAKESISAEHLAFLTTRKNELKAKLAEAA